MIALSVPIHKCPFLTPPSRGAPRKAGETGRKRKPRHVAGRPPAPLCGVEKQTPLSHSEERQRGVRRVGGNAEILSAQAHRRTSFGQREAKGKQSPTCGRLLKSGGKRDGDPADFQSVAPKNHFSRHKKIIFFVKIVAWDCYLYASL